RIFELVIDNLIRAQSDGADKLAIILTNRVPSGDDDLPDYILYPDFDEFVWMSSSATTMSKITNLLGTARVAEIEMEHRKVKRSCHHIYRGGTGHENRHGHSQDNP